MFELLASYGIERDIAIKMFISFLPNIVTIVFIVLIAMVFYKITARVFEAGLYRTQMQSSLVRITVRSIYRGVVIIIALIFILGQFGFNVTAALAGVGVVGLAIGFAAQQTLSNIFSGFGIFIDDLYRKGHWVKISEHYGEVIHISLRTTRIKAPDNSHISIPNSAITAASIVNYSEQGILCVTTRVSVGYGESLDVVRKVLLKALSEMDGVLVDPEPAVWVADLADSSVVMMASIWIADPGLRQRYIFRLNETCKNALDRAKISIPFPQRDVHVISETKAKILKKK